MNSLATSHKADGQIIIDATREVNRFENTLSENPNAGNADHRNTLREELLRR
jgi:hypothetical protein